MTRQPGGEEARYQRFWEQLAEVERRHAPLRFTVAPAAATRESGTAPRYVYETGQLLLCAGDLDRVGQLAERVQAALAGRCGEPRPGPGGIVKLSVDDDISIPAEVDRLHAMLERDDELGTERRAGRVAVSPNHLLSIANPVNLCPADEPAPVPPTAPIWPPRQDGTGGAGVRVLVVDTGLAAGYQDVPWLADIHGADNQPIAADDPYRLVQQYAGHGTFVAGVLRCAAPRAEVTVDNLLVHAGALLEDSLGAGLLDLVERHGWPHLICLPAGGTSHRSGDLLGLRPFLDRLAHDPDAAGTLLVAAAGNDGNDDNLFFPAASAATHPGVISVGALRRDQRGRACFSNHGSSVTVYAAGEDHVNAFLSGLYAYQHQPEPTCRYLQATPAGGCACVAAPEYGTVVYLSGLARWSGTSFATPLVAGMIASHMTTLGEFRDARVAARDLLTRRQVRIRDGDVELPALLLPDAVAAA